MRLSRLTPANIIELKHPKYSTREFLPATFKVGTHNIVKFTESKTMTDEYYVSGANISKYPKSTNGKIPVYCVPLDELVLFEGRE